MDDLRMKGCDLTVVDRTRDALTALGKKRGPIVVGPWLSEIGFELLYWIPFLRWACAFAGLHADDLWIVSRGGCRSWYTDISSHYVDVLDFYSPQEFRAGNARRTTEQSERCEVLGLRHGRTSSKQHVSTLFDRDILAHVTRSTGISSPRVLHPSMMYGLFRPFWLRKLPELYHQMTVPQRLTAPPAIEGLPASYVAAKFYASQACSWSPIHEMTINAIVKALADSTDVVLLKSGERYDDHRDFSICRHPRVHHVVMDPATNLETQTAVIAHASAFVGTYGGFAYLAPFLGVPTRAFYALANFRRDHRQVLDDVCKTALQTKFTVELIGGAASKVARHKQRHRRAA